MAIKMKVEANGYDYGEYEVKTDADEITAYSLKTKERFTICSRATADDVCAYTNNIQDVVTRFICKNLNGAELISSDVDDYGVTAEKWNLTGCFPTAKQETIKKVIPNQESENKTNKPGKNMETKKINCNLSDEELRQLGEPEAYFSVELPKDIKNIGKCAEDGKGYRPVMQAVCLEPERGKLIASDCHILSVADVKCVGEWPNANSGTPFQCFIDPKAIRELAGKTIDIAVWYDENRRQKVTACEAVGVLSQQTMRGLNAFPNWQRVMPKSVACEARLSAGAITDLRKFIKENMGKTKAEREQRNAVIHLTPEADTMQVRIVNDNEEEIATTYSQLREIPTRFVQQCYNAELFYYSIQEDFNGVITFAGETLPSTFYGESRTSILMNKVINNVQNYITDENPAQKG